MKSIMACAGQKTIGQGLDYVIQGWLDILLEYDNKSESAEGYMLYYLKLQVCYG